MPIVSDDELLSTALVCRFDPHKGKDVDAEYVREIAELVKWEWDMEHDGQGYLSTHVDTLWDNPKLVLVMTFNHDHFCEGDMHTWATEILNETVRRNPYMDWLPEHERECGQ
jgi:hypothetical protein